MCSSTIIANVSSPALFYLTHHTLFRTFDNSVDVIVPQKSSASRVKILCKLKVIANY